MTLPAELAASVTQLRAKHTALVEAVNTYRTGTIDTPKQELLAIADKLVEQLEVEEYTLLGQIARKAKLRPRVLQGLREGPGLLFLKGEQGVWYDPSDLSTLFQDAAGTTPVTADGDPGGLMLDKSQGLELGPNLTDTFDLSAFALKSRVQNVSADSFEVADGETDGGVVGRMGVSGKRYTAVVHYTRLTPGDIALTVGTASTAAEQVRETMASSGTITATRSADTVNTIFIRLYGAGASVRIDAIELREVKGNTANQPASARRPVYETDGSKRWLLLDQVDDELELPPIYGDEDNFVFSIAIKPQAASQSNSRYFGMNRAGLNLQCGYMNDGTLFTRVAGVPYNTHQKITLGQAYVIQHIRQGGVSSIRVNGQDAPFSPGDVPTANSTLVNSGSLGGGYQAGSYKAVGEIYGAIYRHGPITEAQLAAIDRYLASKAGVTL